MMTVSFCCSVNTDISMCMTLQENITCEFVLHQQCPECLIHLTWIGFEMEASWTKSSCFVRFSFLHLFKTARKIDVQISCSFFSRNFVKIQWVQKICSYMIISRKDSIYIYIYIYNILWSS